MSIRSRDGRVGASKWLPSLGQQNLLDIAIRAVQDRQWDFVTDVLSVLVLEYNALSGKIMFIIKRLLQATIRFSDHNGVHAPNATWEPHQIETPLGIPHHFSPESLGGGLSSSINASVPDITSFFGGNIDGSSKLSGNLYPSDDSSSKLPFSTASAPAGPTVQPMVNSVHAAHQSSYSSNKKLRSQVIQLIRLIIEIEKDRWYLSGREVNFAVGELQLRLLNAAWLFIPPPHVRTCPYHDPFIYNATEYAKGQGTDDSDFAGKKRHGIPNSDRQIKQQRITRSASANGTSRSQKEANVEHVEHCISRHLSPSIPSPITTSLSQKHLAQSILTRRRCRIQSLIHAIHICRFLIQSLVQSSEISEAKTLLEYVLEKYPFSKDIYLKFLLSYCQVWEYINAYASPTEASGEVSQPFRLARSSDIVNDDAYDQLSYLRNHTPLSFPSSELDSKESSETDSVTDSPSDTDTDTDADAEFFALMGAPGKREKKERKSIQSNEESDKSSPKGYPSSQSLKTSQGSPQLSKVIGSRLNNSIISEDMCLRLISITRTNSFSVTQLLSRIVSDLSTCFYEYAQSIKICREQVLWWSRLQRPCCDVPNTPLEDEIVVLSPLISEFTSVLYLLILLLEHSGKRRDAKQWFRKYWRVIRGESF